MSTSSTERCDFALVGHPSSYEHLVELLLRSRPDYDREKLRRHGRTITKFFEWTPCYALDDPVVLQLHDGQTLTGRMIVCTFLPDELKSPRDIARAHEKSLEALALARQLGAPVIGMGGFTSIVADDAGRRPTAVESDATVTSGSCLTAALTLAQLDDMLHRVGWDLASKTVAILGATGEIGSGCARALSRHASRVLLIARNPAKLEALANELPAATDVEVSADVGDARRASVVIAATSAGKALLTDGDLAPNSIVCDVGYPKTVADQNGASRHALVVSAGLAKLPAPLPIGYYTRLPHQLLYGCFSEAIVLAASGDSTIDSTKVLPHGMAHALRIARSLGFEPAPPYRGGRPLVDEDFDRLVPA